MGAVQMPFERIDMVGPELTELSQPGIDFPERLRLQPIKASLRVDGGFHEASVAQYAEVFRHSWLGHSKPALDFSDRLV